MKSTLYIKQIYTIYNINIWIIGEFFFGQYKIGHWYVSNIIFYMLVYMGLQAYLQSVKK